MRLLWPRDASRHQKWRVSLLLLVMLGAMVPLLWRSFVPTPHWQRTALYLTAVLTACACAALWHGWRTGQWVPAGPWPTFSPLKRWLLAPLCLLFLASMLWLNLATVVPLVTTRWLGQPYTQDTSVQKKRSSASRSCRYQLQIAQVRYWLFEFCIDADAYHALPDGPLPARVTSLRSPLGEEIRTVRLRVPAAAQATP